MMYSGSRLIQIIPEHSWRKEGSMGWWKIKDVETGGIDLSWNRPETQYKSAIPGRDPLENYYNGDEPAALIEKWLGKTVRALEKWQLEPTFELVFDIWRQGGEPFYHKSAGMSKYFDRLHKWATRRMRRIYVDTWARRPYQEEREAAFNFVAKVYFRRI
jgi:hypothetical protein